MNQLPEHLKPEMIRTMETMQVRDSLRMYNLLVDVCFADCVKAFRSNSLDTKEETCINNCAQKYIKLTQRVGYRFAEHQAALGQAQQQSGFALPPGQAPP